MRISGTVAKQGKHWLVELPMLDAMTQGVTRTNAYAMAKDLVETLVARTGFKATIHPGKHGEFELSCSDPGALLGLILKRQRETSGLGPNRGMHTRGTSEGIPCRPSKSSTSYCGLSPVGEILF